MSKLLLPTPATRLLSLPDSYGVLLADFDFYPAHDLLTITWHGHLTADALVRGAERSMQLFADHRLPRRLFSNHQHVTGEWGEALPWLHYEWLPKAAERGVQVLAHVLAPSTASQLINFPGGQEFIAAITQELRAVSFRHMEPAWHWVTTR
jgi:hypothetical protein